MTNYSVEGCCPLPCGNGFPCGVACKCNCWGTEWAGAQCDERWSSLGPALEIVYVARLLSNVFFFCATIWRIIAVSRPKSWQFMDQQFATLVVLLIAIFFGLCADMDPAGQKGILDESRWVTLAAVNVLFTMVTLLLGVRMFVTISARFNPELKAWLRAFHWFVAVGAGGYGLLVLLFAVLDPLDLFTWSIVYIVVFEILYVAALSWFASTTLKFVLNNAARLNAATRARTTATEESTRNLYWAVRAEQIILTLAIVKAILSVTVYDPYGTVVNWIANYSAETTIGIVAGSVTLFIFGRRRSKEQGDRETSDRWVCANCQQANAASVLECARCAVSRHPRALAGSGSAAAGGATGGGKSFALRVSSPLANSNRNNSNRYLAPLSRPDGSEQPSSQPTHSVVSSLPGSAAHDAEPSASSFAQSPDQSPNRAPLVARLSSRRNVRNGGGGGGGDTLAAPLVNARGGGAAAANSSDPGLVSQSAPSAIAEESRSAYTASEPIADSSVVNSNVAALQQLPQQLDSDLRTPARVVWQRGED